VCDKPTLPDKVHVKKPEKDVLPEAAKQDLERRRQRNAKKKQKKLEKRQAKSALRIYLDPSASTGTTCNSPPCTQGCVCVRACVCASDRC
jgi:hypothetical protein